MFKYPWTNFHELNLDWLIRQIRSGNLDCWAIRPEAFPESENPVQDAVDFAANNGMIVLLSSTYNIDKTIVTYDGSVIVGLPGSRLRSVQQDCPGFAPTTLISCESNLLVYGVTFDGDKLSPSGSVIPSDLQPGESFVMAPLIRGASKHNITFANCSWTGYDSNRSTSFSSVNYACLGLSSCEDVQLIDCTFEDCLREGCVFEACNSVTVERCTFNMGDYTGHTYTEIGIGQTNNVRIIDCDIVKGDTVTSSVINAMGDDITIQGCHIRAIASNFGIDYGNEISNTFTANNLLITECTLECHISGATTFPIDHTNIKIINNLIDATDITSGSGVIAVYGSNDNAFQILNNHFYGTTLSRQGIRVGNFSDLKITISGNTFEGPAIWISEMIPPMFISNNWFKSDAITQTVSDANAYTVSLISCKCDRAGRFGTVDAGNAITFHLVGCDFRRDICTNAFSVDSSLSYIRGV